MSALLTDTELWSALKPEAHELLLSARCDAPILAHRAVVAGLIDLGLINPDLTLTDAGVSLVLNR